MQQGADRDSLLSELARWQERERATRTILEVISRSRDDEAPVFEAILDSARSLSGATTAALMLGRPEDEHLRLAALDHADPVMAAAVVSEIAQINATPMKMDPAVHVSARAICEGRAIHIADMRETPSYLDGEPSFRLMVDEQGLRSILSVPLMDARGALGAINLHRKVPGLFRDDEIAMVETFAAQAVIAIEKVRQFREVRTRLEREEASREILQAISASRTDPAPVFDVILRNAAQLSGAPLANLCLLNAARSHWHLVAHYGAGLRHLAIGKTTTPLDRELVPAVAMRTAQIVHIEDLTDTDLYRQGDPGRVAMVEVEGMRTILCVPLLTEARAIGCITLFRREVKGFTADEIGLVETFAAQAVIAIENVHQFRALQDKTEEVQALNASLESRVQEQVGEIERMGRLKRFLPAAVADTVVSSGSETMLRSHRALLGVLFCDIRGFTAFCETAEPEETIEVLQTYHREMGKLIDAHGAGVDHRMGDGIMVLFNDPLPCDDPAGDAVRLAVAMRARMAELCRGWKRMGHRLGFGVGVSLGYATVGMVGFEGRSDYTASGTAINIGARLCDMAEDGEILLSTRAAIAVEDGFPSVSVGEVTLKGIREPVEVFRLTGGAAG